MKTDNYHATPTRSELERAYTLGKAHVITHEPAETKEEERWTVHIKGHSAYVSRFKSNGRYESIFVMWAKPKRPKAKSRKTKGAR